MKQYTTEEITRRLKAGEKVTCILYNGLYFWYGLEYEFSHFSDDMSKIHFHVGNTTTCIGAEYFNKYFMFTYDYEAMKSEDVVKRDTPKEEPQIPEWLQRERVRFWCDVLLQTEGTAIYRINTANTYLATFDKRFLNQKD